MSSKTTVDAARVELLLGELRLPGVKLIWAKIAEQSDKEGWPAARFLAALAEHEMADRGRRRMRAALDRGAAACRQDARHFRLRQCTDRLQGSGDGARVGRCVVGQGRQHPVVRPARGREKSSIVGARSCAHREWMARVLRSHYRPGATAPGHRWNVLTLIPSISAASSCVISPRSCRPSKLPKRIRRTPSWIAVLFIVPPLFRDPRAVST